MRFLIINTDYPEFIRDDYARHAGLVKQSFASQLEHRYDTLFGTANFYSKNLRDLGHEAIDLFANHEYIQRQWAKDHNVAPEKNKRKWFRSKSLSNEWMENILAAQIAWYEPDVLYIMAMEAMRPEFLLTIKSQFYRLKIVGQHAALLTDNMRNLSGYDLVLSSLPNQVDYFRAKDVKSHLFRLGFEASILNLLPKTKKKYGAIHIGGYGPVHNERSVVLEKLAAEIPVDFWGYGEENLKPSSEILKSFHGFVGGKQMYEILQQSQLTMTKHIKRVAGTHANNMTLYEATGVGTLLLVDERSDLDQIFEPEKEVVVYRNAAELIEKTKYYLSHPADNKRIAQAGQARTLKDHSYKKRMRELVAILNEELWGT